MVEKNNRSLRVLLLFTFFMVVGFEMIMPLIIGHFVSDLQFVATKVGIALAVRKFSQQGLAIVGGILADRRDIKKLISIGMALRVLGFALLGLSNTFPLLLLCMVLIGFGGVLFEAPYQTAIATLTTEENRAKYYSLNNTVIGVASTFGPLLGAIMLKLDFKYVCFGAAVCFLINFLLSIIFLPSITRSKNAISIQKTMRLLRKDSSYIKFTVLMVIFWLAASQIDISFPLKIQAISGKAESVSWMYSIYAAVTALIQYPLVSYLLKKYKPKDIVVFGVALITISLLVIPLSNSTGSFLSIVVIFTLGMLMARPNQQSIAVALADSEATGAYLGFNYLGFAIGSGFGTVIGGIFFDYAKASGMYHVPWYLFSFISLVALIGFQRFDVNHNKKIRGDIK